MLLVGQVNPEVTTRELLEQLSYRGFAISQKLLADLSRRGLISRPVRRRCRKGGAGSENYWPEDTLTRLDSILTLRKAGKGYPDIESLVPSKASRVSLTIWLPGPLKEELETLSRATKKPVTGLLQHGAHLSQYDPKKTSDETFTQWAEAILAHYKEKT